MCVPVQVFGRSDGLFRFFYVEFRAVRALRVQKGFLSSDFEKPTPSRRARGRVGWGSVIMMNMSHIQAVLTPVWMKIV